MKTVILSPKPKKEQEIVYFEDIENMTFDESSDFVLVVDNSFVLLSNDKEKFQWFDVDELTILTEEFKNIKSAIQHFQNIDNIKIFDWREFDISKVGK